MTDQDNTPVVETEVQETEKPKKAKKVKEPKEPKPVLTPEGRKANRAISARKVLEKRKANGVAAKQFFIHKSLFKKAEEVMAPIITESNELIGK